MRKIILSRKGYDDQYGGKPSAILPDGTMLSFPIPVSEPELGIGSSELTFEGRPLSELLTELGHQHTALIHHVDPDIYHLIGDSPMGSYGQAGAALNHLDNQKVNKGDIFLFFGTFCKTFSNGGSIKYEKMHPFHAIFGYLVVDRRVTINEIDTEPDLHWLKKHPHYENQNLGDYKKANVIYISQDYGYFKFSNHLMLTKPGYLKSYWQLPVAFADVKITYHDKAFRRASENCIELISVAKGQEFVFESTEKLELWVNILLNQRVGPILNY